MATGKAFVPTDMPNLEVWSGNVVSETADEIIISDNYRTTVYSGSFSYGFLRDVGGELLSIKEYRDGDLIYSVTDINTDASDVYEAIQILGDAQLSAQLILNGKDTLTGSEGSDNLRSYADDDVLEGLDGNDTLDGGPGNDSLFGGDGYDTFVFAGAWGQDSITDPDNTGKIQFIDHASEDLNFANESGDLVITADTNEVRFVDYYSSGLNYDFTFSDGVGGDWSIAPADSAVNEGSDTIIFSITRPDPTRNAVYYGSTVQNQGASNAGDYGDAATSEIYTGLLNKEISFGAGELTATIKVSINDDNEIESAETFQLIVQRDPTEPENVFLASTTFTITDNDAPSGAAPVVTGNASGDLDVTGTDGGVTRVTGDQLVDVSDIDGDVSYIRFYDATAGEDGGTFTLDGAPIADPFVDVGPAGLDRVAYEAGPKEGTNEIAVQAFDGEGNGSEDLTITINVSVPEAPVEIERATKSLVYLSTSTGALYTWDGDSDNVALIGNTSVVLTDLAIAPDGDLYGISQTDLYKIDAGTAEAFKVGPLAGDLFFGVDALTDAQGFDISPDDVARVSSGNNSVVAVLDLETGAVSNPFGPSLGRTTSSGDIWFAENDRYFVTTNSFTLLTIAPSTFGEGIADNDFITNDDIQALVSLAGPTNDQRAGLIGFSDNAFYSLAEGETALPGLELGTLPITGDITGAAQLRSKEDAPPANSPPTLTGDLVLEVSGTEPTTIMQTDLGAEDRESGSGALRFEVSELFGGNIIVNGTTASTFTKADIDAGIVQFAPIGNDFTVRQFTVRVIDDGGLRSESASVNVNAAQQSPPSLAEIEYFAKQISYARQRELDAPDKQFFGYDATIIETGISTFQAVGLTKPGFAPVLAIRGTQSTPEDWIENFRASGAGFDEFANAWETGALQEWLRDNPGAYFTGHSQGGAQAQLAALAATSEGFDVRGVRTFNAPGIPEEAFEQYGSLAPTDVSHVISRGDIVSLVGDTYLEGSVEYYDAVQGYDGPRSFVNEAHTGHWSSTAIYDALQGAGDTGLIEDYEQRTYTSLNIPEGSEFATLDSGAFGYVSVAGSSPLGGISDPEFVEFLANIEKIGKVSAFITSLKSPLTSLSVDEAADLVLNALQNRANAESAREDLGWAVRFVLNVGRLKNEAENFLGPDPDLVPVSGPEPVANTTPAALLGDESPNTMTAGGGSFYAPGLGADKINLQVGPDTIFGDVADFDGDEYTDFEVAPLVDQIVAPGENTLAIESSGKGSAILSLDGDNDGISDAAVTLLGDYRLDGFFTETDGTYTYLRYLGNETPDFHGPTSVTTDDGPSARVFLADDRTFNAASDSLAIFGAAGTEQVTIFDGVTGATVASSVERVDLPGDIADFTFSSFGNSLTIHDASDDVVAQVSDAGGKQVVFGNGALDAAFDAGTLTLGGETPSTDAGAPTAITPAASEIDTDTPTENINDGPVTDGPAARVFLADGRTFNAASDSLAVFGAAGTEQVTIFDGVTGVTVASSVERVDLPGDIAEFTFSSFGNSLTIHDATGDVVAQVSDAGGKQIVFGNGALDAAFDAGTLTLGGETTSTDAGAPTAITPEADAIDPTDGEFPMQGVGVYDDPFAVA